MAWSSGPAAAATAAARDLTRHGELVVADGPGRAGAGAFDQDVVRFARGAGGDGLLRVSPSPVPVAMTENAVLKMRMRGLRLLLVVVTRMSVEPPARVVKRNRSVSPSGTGDARLLPTPLTFESVIVTRAKRSWRTRRRPGGRRPASVTTLTV